MEQRTVVCASQPPRTCSTTPVCSAIDTVSSGFFGYLILSSMYLGLVLFSTLCDRVQAGCIGFVNLYSCCLSWFYFCCVERRRSVLHVIVWHFSSSGFARFVVLRRLVSPPWCKFVLPSGINDLIRPPYLTSPNLVPSAHFPRISFPPRNRRWCRLANFALFVSCLKCSNDRLSFSE